MSHLKCLSHSLRAITIPRAILSLSAPSLLSSTTFTSSLTTTTTSASCLSRNFSSHAPHTPPARPSFIDRAKAEGRSTLLGPFRSAGYFDNFLEGSLVVDDLKEEGFVSCTLTVDERMRNSYGGLHGGAITTIIDVVGTLALLANDPKRGGVSVEINVNYLSAVKVGEKVTVTGKVLKTGKSLGFTQVDIIKQDGK